MIIQYHTYPAPDWFSESRKMDQYIDIQYFKIQNQIIIKELCILIDDSIAHYLFKCPFNFDFLSEFDKCHVKWVENN